MRLGAGRRERLPWSGERLLVRAVRDEKRDLPCGESGWHWMLDGVGSRATRWGHHAAHAGRHTQPHDWAPRRWQAASCALDRPGAGVRKPPAGWRAVRSLPALSLRARARAPGRPLVLSATATR